MNDRSSADSKQCTPSVHCMSILAANTGQYLDGIDA